MVVAPGTPLPPTLLLPKVNQLSFTRLPDLSREGIVEEGAIANVRVPPIPAVSVVAAAFDPKQTLACCPATFVVDMRVARSFIDKSLQSGQ
jgi:hypothetical protein